MVENEEDVEYIFGKLIGIDIKKKIITVEVKEDNECNECNYYVDMDMESLLDYVGKNINLKIVDCFVQSFVG